MAPGVKLLLKCLPQKGVVARLPRLERVLTRPKYLRTMCPDRTVEQAIGQQLEERS